MTNKILFITPDTASDVKFYNAGLSSQLFIEYNDETFELRFKDTLCCRYSTFSMATTIYDAYEQLVEVSESDWLDYLVNVGNYGKQEKDVWQLRHFAIFLEDFGLYECLAREITIYKNGEVYEFSEFE